MKSKHPIEANPANTVLLVVNMQNEFCMPGGLLFDEICPTRMPRIAEATGRLVERVRIAGIPVVHIQSLRDQRAPQFAIFGEKAILEPGKWNSDFITEAAPVTNDRVEQSWYDDPFYKTRLDYMLTGLGPEPTTHQVIVVGGHISGAVYHVVNHLYLRGYWTVMALDAIYGDDEGMAFGHDELFDKPYFPNIFFSEADLVETSRHPRTGVRGLVPRE